MLVLERYPDGKPRLIAYGRGEWPHGITPEMHEANKRLHAERAVVAETQPAPSEPPGLLRRMGNFARAALQHIATGAEKAPADVQALRLAICRNCPLKVIEPILGDVCSHKDCGCSLAVKTGWSDQRCPLDPPKWGPTASEAQRTASERLEELVAECDYRGGIVTAGSCKCVARWHCAMAKGDPDHPHEVTKAQCLQCVLGK